MRHSLRDVSISQQLSNRKMLVLGVTVSLSNLHYTMIEVRDYDSGPVLDEFQ